MLKSHGFENTHIAKMIQTFPTLLNKYKADENLKPKLDYLVENGFKGSQLHDLIVRNPAILGRSLRCCIKPSVEFLGTEERLKLAVERHSRLLTNDLGRTLQPNVELLVKEGVPRDAIADFFVMQPGMMQARAETKTVKHELSIPIDPTADPFMFLRAVSVMARLDVSVWEKRVTLFKTLFGCPQEEVLSIFWRYPTCFGPTEETLRSKVDFYFNTVQLKREAIINNPSLLSYSLDKRIRPRYNVFKLLLSKKLLTEDSKQARLFKMGEDEFSNKYATQHLLEVPNLLEMYTNDKMKKKTGN